MPRPHTCSRVDRLAATKPIRGSSYDVDEASRIVKELAALGSRPTDIGRLARGRGRRNGRRAAPGGAAVTPREPVGEDAGRAGDLSPVSIVDIVAV